MSDVNLTSSSMIRTLGLDTSFAYATTFICAAAMPPDIGFANIAGKI